MARGSGGEGVVQKHAIPGTRRRRRSGSRIIEEIGKRIAPLFAEVKQEYGTIFQGSEEISLTDRALAFMISELSKYEFTRIDVDAKGAAYQEIVGTNLRGDRGQYFTPRAAIRLVVEMLDPGEDERVLDPACGTGGCGATRRSRSSAATSIPSSSGPAR